jgi:glycosyltransferase involved in cell wall biosynthesis
VAFALADTSVAATDLRRQGYEDVRVCPLPPDLAVLRDVPSHSPTAHHFEKHVEGPLLVFSGRMAPAERLDFLVAAYHALVTYLTPDVNLALLGPGPVTGYQQVIEDLVWRLALYKAWVAKPGRSELATYLRRATLFVTASEDPGLSFPALEALTFGIPVVARAAGGMAETLDGGGVLVPADGGPLLFAETLAAVLHDGPLRTTLISRAGTRAAALGRERVDASFLGQLLTVTG